MTLSSDVLDLLKVKHDGDVFVPECKDGPTQMTTHFRMDAWAMKRSWSTPVTWGYEIKVSRSDFVNDDKWQNYLPLCSDFYFVCPSGLINPEELPPEAGVIWVSKTGSRLFTKKKAARRIDVEVPESLYRYILMTRWQLSPEKDPNWQRQAGADYWRRWLKGKDELHELGYEVRGRIKDYFKKAGSSLLKMRKRLKFYKKFRRQLKDAGVNLNMSDWGIRREIDELKGTVPSQFLRDVQEVKRGLEAIEKELSK